MENSGIEELELIGHCVQHMSNKQLIKEFLDRKKIQYSKKDFKNYKSLADFCKKSGIKLDELTLFFREKWHPTNLQKHIENLKSGLLNGHSWHQTSPSMLHLGLQNKVRDYIEGEYPLNDLLEIGTDIMKHEYFMVAQHDICETTIINSFESVIPPIGNKSITDFVFKKIPVDLKITTFPDDYKNKEIKSIDDKIKLATSLYEGADKQRLRKQASQTYKNWGLNRMYIITKDPNQWFNNPEKMLNDIKTQLEKEEPFCITLDNNIKIMIFLIVI